MARKQKTEGGQKPGEDDKVVTEAQKRFERCIDWEATSRSRQLDDLRFYNGDPDNGYQWPVDVRKNRDVDKRPVLTVNKTRQYCLQVTNDCKQNKSAIKAIPTGDKATADGADVMSGIIRYIEYNSNAQQAYDYANETQVQLGVGYWRVLTDYVSNDSFDQDLFVRRIKDPFSVYIDPDAQEADASDMNFAFVYTDMPRDRFDAQYSQYSTKVGHSTFNQDTNWLDDDHVRVCEYYRRTDKQVRLIAMTDPQTGESVIKRDDGIPKEVLNALLEDETTKVRWVTENRVEWFKIAGDIVIDKSVWLGSTIPIVRVIGEESVIEGKLDRKGHVRALKDPQRIYNYWTSSAVESVALQPKIPFVGPAAAIEGYENEWRTANTVNYSILPYNHLSDEGQPIPPPQRAAPVEMPSAYVNGLQISANEMQMVSGQHEADLGEQGNERSGKAINARQRMGDKATYHFIDNLSIGIRYTGKILIEMIPLIYDTRRVLKIMGEDGVQSDVQIDPEAQAEYQEQQAGEDKVQIIFNPTFAKYSVQADIGPAYSTRRQEAFNAFVQIMTGNPELMGLAGDLMFRAADFPMADELAERLKRMVPAQALGKGPSAEMQNLMAQNKQLMDNLQTLVSTYAEERVKWKGVEEGKQVDAFKAETDRIKVLFDQIDPSAIAQMTAQLVLETMGTNLPINGNAAQPQG